MKDNKEELNSNKTKYIGIGTLILALVLALISAKLISFTAPVKIITNKIEDFSNELNLNNTKENVFGIFNNMFANVKYSEELMEMVNNSENIESTSNLSIKMPSVLKNQVGFENFNVDVNLKKSSDNLEAKIDALLDNKNLVNLETILKDNTLYYKLLKNSEKYYSYNLNNFQENMNNENINVQIFIDLFNETIKENIMDSDFKKSSEKIKVDNEEIKTTKYSLEINKKLNERFMKAFLTKIKDNKTAIESLTNISGLEEKDLKESINNSIKEYKYEGESLYLDLYIKSSELKRLDFGSKKEKITTIYGASKVYDLSSILNIKEAKIIVDDKQLEVKLNDKDVNMSLTIKGEDKKEFTASIKASGVEFSINGTYCIEEVKKDEEYKNITNMNVKYKYDGVSIEIPVKINGTTKKVDKLEIPNVKKAINIETMTEKQMSEFQNEIQKMPIFDLIKSTQMEVSYKM
ncbi:MAG: hypothetical protein IJ574_00800 [Bacilli bacterium]|nr:hypothetical protein [Bacilli bacterium]